MGPILAHNQIASSDLEEIPLKLSCLSSCIAWLTLGVATLPLCAQAPTANPPSISLSAPINSTTAVTQTLTLTGVPSELWQIQAVGGFWLRFTSATCPGSVVSCTSTNPLSGSTTITVVADPTTINMISHLYAGQITVSYPGGVLTIPVNFTIGGSSNAGVLTASPTSLTFATSPSGIPPQVVSITATGGGGNTIFFNAATNVPWLTTNLGTGATFAPSNVTVTANATGLSAGTHSGTVTFTPTGGGTPINVAVTLNTGAAQQLVTNPTAVSFSGLPGGSGLTPVPVAISVSSGANVPYTASISYPGLAAQNWLGLSTTSGQTGTSLTLSTTGNVANLPAGTYAATVTIASPGLTPVYLPVSLTLSTSSTPTTPRLISDVSSLAISVPPTAQASRTFLVSTSTGVGVPYTVAQQYTSPAVDWLSLSGASGTTSANVTVTVNPGFLPAGTYTANLLVSTTTPGFTPLSIPVTMTVTTGQVITFTPSSLGFSYTGSGAISAVQNVQLGLAPVSPAQPATVTATPDVPGQTWLTAVLLSSTPGSVTNGSQIAVTMNAAGLPNGTYTGKVQLSVPAVSNPLIQIPVTLTVSGTTSGTTVLFSPSQLNFSAAINTSPADQNLTVTTNTAAAIPYGLSANVPWITFVNNGAGTTPNSAIVRVNTAGLGAGTHNGNITLNAPGASNNGAVVPVVLTLSGTNVPLVLSPTSLSFIAQANGGPPPPLPVWITSTGAALPYSVTSNQPWLQAIAATAMTPGSLAVYVNPGGLAPGIYSGTLTVSSTGLTLTIPVTLEITSGPLLRLSQQSVTYNYQTGQALPSPRTILINASSGAALAATVSVATASGGNWLSATPATVQTPGGFALGLLSNVVSALPAGNYAGTVTVTAPGPGATTLTSVINVTLNVSASSLLSMSTAPAAFNAEVNGNPPPAQARQITATGGGLNLLSSVSTSSGSGWLTASLNSNTTPATLTISASPFGLSTGVYSGNVTISSGGSGTVTIGANALVIPVTLTVGSVVTLNVDKSELLFTGATSAAPQTIQVSSTSGNSSFNVTASSGSSAVSWLTVAAASGVTPATISVTANPGVLTDGTYSGSITITPLTAGSTPVRIPVTLVVNRGTAIQLTPSVLNFTFVRGGSLPAQQSIQVTSQQPIPFSFSSAIQTPAGVNWLAVAQAGAQTNGSLQVALTSAASTLPVGSYTATITVFDLTAQTSVPVTVNLSVVSPASSVLVATPNALTFNGRVGGPVTPATRTVEVTSTIAGAPLAFNVTSDALWLSGTPLSGTTPATITVSVNGAALPGPNAVGHLTIVPLVGGQTATITVTFVADPAAAPVIAAFANAATFAPGPLSPGMLFSIFGTNLGPAQAVSGEIVGGRFTTSLSGVRVLFDGIPAPILYASSTQINAAVPYQLFGRAFAQMSVEVNGVSSTQLAPRIADTAPGIFAIPGGQAAALNGDGSLNNAGNPAAAGSIVVLYVTGEGQTTPGGVDGEVVAATNLKRPLAAVRVRVNGVDIPASDILYAGSAPGLVSGLMQINFRLAADTPANASTPVQVIVGEGQSPVGITIAVRQ
jgi:uncharacterized protein (TIGR03437 family)